MKRLLPYVPALAIGAAAIALAWIFAQTTRVHAGELGLPLDDSYIYLTYAKQFGRGEPFTYFSGGGYSAGSTSALWPMVLAPFWTVGARGHALVWVSFVLCTALYALTLVGVYRLVRELVGGHVAGVLAAVMALCIAPFAWSALAGMEVAFASALLVWSLFLLARAPTTGPPSKLLIACLAATSLSRPEAMMIVFLVVAVAIVQRARARAWRAVALWVLPVVPPLAWLVANKLFAGNFMPNTGVAKSHFYLPGFDWSYWWAAVTDQTGRALHGLLWAATSPLVWPQLVIVLWLGGAVRVVVWARRERRPLAGFLVLTAPFGLVMSVIASSGQWSFQNYRYIAPAFPLLFVVIGCAFAPVRRHEVAVRRAWTAGAIVLVALFARASVPKLRDDVALFAQNAVDLNRQVVTLGRYIDRKLPDARIMFHDAGAVAYYGDTPVYDMLGLVTNYQTHVANHGPGARFEFLESLPPARRPTHFTYYPEWMGQAEFFGEVLLETPLARPFHRRRLIGSGNMQLIAARWWNVQTAELPLSTHAGWRVVDRIDIADIASERAHAWRGAIGRRKFGDPTARWTFFHREVHRERGLVLDGGRTIRGGRETFELAIDPQRPLRLVIRTGGRRDYPWHEPITKPVVLEIVDGPVVLARAELPTPTGSVVEVGFELPRGRRTIEVRATGPYRVFHWFALQPESP